MDQKHFANLKTAELQDSEVAITGEITLSFLVECRKKAIKELSIKTRIPGFRPGHIPEEVLVRNLGELSILEEAAEIALGEAYPLIVKEAGVAAIGRPNVSITKLAPGIPLEFKILTAVEPAFELPDYKKLAIESLDEDKEKRRVKIVEALVKASTIPVPKVLVESELQKMLGQFMDDVSRAGAKWEDYLKSIHKTEEDIKAEWRQQALDRAKAELIINKISEREKIEPSAEELEHEAKHLLEHFPAADPLRARLYIYALLRNQKVLDFLEGLT